ncbi:hypothetical protein [Lawsonia intracellularis]|nr:hypothetical protein [Lawsonia intracellularis]UYH53557.1 hypothetical protein OCT60_00400 [Lawsonia intracellularis]
MRVDAGQRINQALMADTTQATSTNETSEAQNTEKTEGSKGSSKLCGMNCKKGLKLAGRIALAVLTLGISEGVRKGIEAYQARQVKSEGARMGKLWETGKPSFPEKSGIHNPSATDDNDKNLWTSSSQKNSGGVNSFGKESPSPSSGSSGSHFVFHDSPQKPSSGITAETTLKTNSGGATGE